MANPRVFISYSWDSDDHRAWALMLADRLVQKGVDVEFDQYDIKLGRNIKRKMEQNVESVDKVILILTEKYKAKADGREGGIGFEYTMINNEWYEEQSENHKFIPVLRSGTKKTSIPLFIRGYLYADMREDENFEKAFEDILRTIYNKPRISKPPLGPEPDFEEQDRTYTPPPLSTPISTDSSDGSIGDDIDRSNRIHEVQKSVQKLIRSGELEGALDALGDFADEDGNKKLSNEVTLLFGRYNTWKTQTTMDLLGNNQATVMKNKIQYAILSTADGLR